jgi:hypothetical protein
MRESPVAAITAAMLKRNNRHAVGIARYFRAEFIGLSIIVRFRTGKYII